MKTQKTQQFARFFLKDLKTKNPKFNNDKSDFDQLNSSSDN